jgi:hypothetical protein
MAPGDLNDDDPITRPETPAALRVRVGEQLVTNAQSIARAAALLELLDGSDREYFACRLADDAEEHAAAVRDYAAAIRASGTEVKHP